MQTLHTCNFTRGRPGGPELEQSKTEAAEKRLGSQAVINRSLCRAGNSRERASKHTRQLRGLCGQRGCSGMAGRPGSRLDAQLHVSPQRKRADLHQEGLGPAPRRVFRVQLVVALVDRQNRGNRRQQVGTQTHLIRRQGPIARPHCRQPPPHTTPKYTTPAPPSCPLACAAGRLHVGGVGVGLARCGVGRHSLRLLCPRCPRCPPIPPLTRLVRERFTGS